METHPVCLGVDETLSEAGEALAACSPGRVVYDGDPDVVKWTEKKVWCNHEEAYTDSAGRCSSLKQHCWPWDTNIRARLGLFAPHHVFLHTGSHRDAHANGDSNQHRHADAHAQPHGQSDAYGDPVSHVDGDAQRHVDSNRNADGDVDPNRYAATYANANTATSTCVYLHPNSVRVSCPGR